MSDLHESIRQDMQEKTPDKLKGLKAHQFHPAIIIGIPIADRDLSSLQFNNAVIGYGHPMGITPEILYGAFGVLEGGFTVYDPILIVESTS